MLLVIFFTKRWSIKYCFPYTDEPDLPIIKLFISVIILINTLTLWGYGIYYFGVEAYASDWEIGKVAILALWTICSGPLIAGGLYLITLLLCGLGLLLLMPFTRK